MNKPAWMIPPALALLAATPALAAEPAPPAAPATVGLIGMGLNATNLERSARFYLEGLGMKELSRIDAGSSTQLFLGYPDTPYPPMLEIIVPKDPAKATATVTSSFKLVISTPNAAAVAARFRAAGFAPGEVHTNPTTGGASFWIKDPDGYSLEIVQRPARKP